MIRAGPVGRIETRDVKWDEKGHSMIPHIYVSFCKDITEVTIYKDYYHNDVVTSVQFGYWENGALVLSPKYGASEGHNFRLVRLDQDEYVTGLSGEPVPVGFGGGIRNLTFHTNRGKHGPFGYLDKDNGSKIEIGPAICNRHEFGGFFGSHNSLYLSSIGIYVKPNARYDLVAKREKI